MNRIYFEILGEPVPKARHRTARTKSGGLVQYNNPKAKRDEANFQAQALQHRPAEPLDGPVMLRVDACMKIPSSWSNKKKTEAVKGKIRPTKKPDLDNLLKFVADSLNGIFWQDDKQIVWSCVTKRYAVRPRWVVGIYWEEE